MTEEVPDYVKKPDEAAGEQAPWEPPTAPKTQPNAPQEATAQTTVEPPKSDPEPPQEPTQAPTGTPDWIQGMGADQDMDDPERPSRGQSGFRFWLPKGDSKYIIFLTDGGGPLPYGPPAVYEHNPPIGQGKGRWQNWMSCLKPLGISCPLCKWAEDHDRQGARYKGLFFSILDCTAYTDSKGVEHKMTKKVLCAKKDTAELIARKWAARVENGEKLRGAMFKVFRGSGDKSPAVGDDYEFVRMVDLNRVPEEFREPHDWKEILAPNPQQVKSAVERMQQEHTAFGGQGDFNPPAEGAAGPQVEY